AARGLQRRLAWERRELRAISARTARSGLEPALRRSADRLRAAGERLRFALDVRVRHARTTVAHQAGRLDALSPLACLARGYAIVRRGDAAGPVVSDAGTLGPGDPVALVLARGRARARLIDRELGARFPPLRTRLRQAIRYSLLAGGKRIRPILALAAGEIAGASPRLVLPFACALEMIHTYSLVHDDLPAMDDDELR